MASDWYDHGRARHRVRDDPAVHAEDLPHALAGDHVGGCTRRRDLAVAHRDEVVGIARREVELVQDHHDRGAVGGVELTEQVEHLDLVGDVEVGRGFVEQQQVGLLGEGHRDPDPLPLSPRELVDDPVGETQGVGRLEGAGHGGLVRGRPALESALVRGAPAADEVDDGHAFGGDGVLGEQAQGPRDVLGGYAVDRLPVQQHLAATRLEQAGQAAQQGRLAAGVGPDDDGDLAVGQARRDVVDHDPLVVAEGQVLRDQPAGRRVGHGPVGRRRSGRPARSGACGACCGRADRGGVCVRAGGRGDRGHEVLLVERPVASSHRRNGAPQAPVTTPTGRLRSGTR